MASVSNDPQVRGEKAHLIRRMFAVCSPVMSEAKDQKLTVLMSETDMKRLRELADSGEVSVSHVIRHLIRVAHDAAFEENAKTRAVADEAGHPRTQTLCALRATTTIHPRSSSSATFCATGRTMGPGPPRSIVRR